jgi:hypothetical protein
MKGKYVICVGMITPSMLIMYFVKPMRAVMIAVIGYQREEVNIVKSVKQDINVKNAVRN